MATRPFTLLGAAVLQELDRRFNQVLLSWCSAWGMEPAAVKVLCSRAWEASSLALGLQWRRYGAEAGLWIGWQPDFASDLQNNIFPPDPHCTSRQQNHVSIAVEGTKRAVETLIQSIGESVGIPTQALIDGEECAPLEEIFSMASGAISACFQVAGKSIRCLLTHETVQEIGRHPDQNRLPALPRVPLFTLLNQIPVTLPVQVGQAEVDLGSLLTLAPGDVIRLKSTIDQPLKVLGPAGEVVCRGYLGMQEQSMAIETINVDRN